MRIKSISIDGFKSYGRRMELTGLDATFNAITGLNGTGKSNILDAICFVFGINKLGNIRANNLQELIYKNGQAGVTRATVCITFDNSSRSHRPPGYDHPEVTVTRQVVMGGKNRYYINGQSVANKRVAALFNSIQLNVNNPHFLIMQGRITKVLNMNPPEVLSMLEEAVGTSMYESKKQSTIKTIQMKDSKLAELEHLIKEEIAPRLQKLADERAKYQEHQQVLREIESTKKLHVAWKFFVAEQETIEAEASLATLTNSITKEKDYVKELQNAIKNIDVAIAEINQVTDQESDGTLRQLELDLQELEKTEAVTAAALKAAKEAGAAHSAQAARHAAALSGGGALLQAKQAQLDQMTESFDNLRVASEASEAALVLAQQRYIAVSTGQENPSESLQDQLLAAKQEESEASTRIAQNTTVKQNAEQRLRALQKEFRSKAAQFERDQQTIAGHQEQIDAIQEKLSTLNFDEDRNTELKESIRALQGSARSARDVVGELSAQLQRCNFQYQPPPNFDRRRVSGTVSRLIEVTDPVYAYALEKTAGNKLFNVVVDTDETGKLLLQRGNLRTRATIIPLNKISGHVIGRHVVELAQQIGGGPTKVQLALDLIAFEAHLRPAIEWVFGSTLVCSDLATAKLVTFHPRVQRRCVTLDGDVCDPAGTLSGGARQPGEPVLLQLARLRRQERELAAAEAQLAGCSAELQASQQVFDQYHGLQQQFEVKSRELEAVKARLAATSQAQLHEEIDDLQKQVTELSTAMERDKDIQRAAAAKIKDLEMKIKDIKSYRERELSKASADLKRAKTEAAEHGEAWQHREQALEVLRAELEVLRQAAGTAQQQDDDMRAAAAGLQQDLAAAERDHAEAALAVSLMQTCITRQKEDMGKQSAEIQGLLADKEEKAASIRNKELEIKELNLNIKEIQGTVEAGQSTMSELVVAHPWVPLERVQFGEPGGPYDFTVRRASSAGHRLRQLDERRQQLARCLNSRAHNLLTKEEEQFQTLLYKKGIVEEDRSKLLETIAELDDKKRITLIKACDQVNRDFAAIFSMLLPGAQARLEPLAGCSVLEGLQMHVGFNGKWKESLSELSGGQRSLVALSLVLAMLLFKPAPLYVLDEVDAALDLSHTQNIGRMLRHHFGRAQFIIVSLKEGMFNHANVLYKTRFEDGMSTVYRTDNRPAN